MSFNTSTRKKDDMSLKLRSTNLRNAQENTKKLELDNRKMEERLNELKMAMSREKEERDQSQGGFWKTGQAGTLSEYAKEVIHKPNKPKNPKQRKIKVLKEEITVEPPQRNKGPGSMAHIAQRSTGGSTGKENKAKGPRCGQCEDKGAQVSCVECGEDYCAPCFAAFHMKGALKKHRSIPFGSAGSRTPRGMVTPKGQGQSLQTSPTKTPTTHQMEPLPEPQPITEKPSSVNGGPSLLDGVYNEEDSAAAFQEALKAWRTPGDAANRTVKVVSPVKSPVVNTESSTSTEAGPTGTPDIKFTASLSYAERLLLKKHRRAELPPVSISPSASKSSEDNNHNYMVMSSASAPALNHDPEETPVEVLQELRRTNEDGIQWREIHRAMKEDPSVMDDWRSDSRVSIIQLDNDKDTVKPGRQRRPQAEKTTYHVTEVGQDEDARLLSARTQRAVSSATKRTYHEKPTTVPPGASSSKQPSTAVNPARAKSKSSPSKVRPDTTELSLDLDTVKGQGQAVKPKSSRAKSSRRCPSRPQSRAMSRAETRMALFGEGELTKAPSDGLREVARMTLRSEQPSFRPTMTDFFTGGFVTPEEVKDRVMTPRSLKTKDSSKDAGIPKWKISYNLYNIGPRSWRPTSSLQDTVSDQDVIQTIDITGPHLREVTPTADPEARLIETVSYSIASGLTHTESRQGDREDTNLLPSDLAKMKVNTSRSSAVPNHLSASQIENISPSSSQMLTPRPESRAIVVDGDDLSSFDHEVRKQEQNEEDEEALFQLEWELASHEGRVTADGKMSRLSQMSPGLQESPEPMGPQITNLALLNDGRSLSPGASYDNRVEYLMDDFEEMEKQMLEEDEVKALH